LLPGDPPGSEAKAPAHASKGEGMDRRSRRRGVFRGLAAVMVLASTLVLSTALPTGATTYQDCTIVGSKPTAANGQVEAHGNITCDSRHNLTLRVILQYRVDLGWHDLAQDEKTDRAVFGLNDSVSYQRGGCAVDYRTKASAQIDGSTWQNDISNLILDGGC